MPSSLNLKWKHRWSWATSSAVREQVRQEHAQDAFLQFLASSDPATLNDAGTLTQVLTGASSDLVNSLLPASFSTIGGDPDAVPTASLSPLMWAVCRSQWGLVRNLLDHGADPMVKFPDTLVHTHAKWLDSDLTRFRHSQRPDSLLTMEASITPFALAVIFVDQWWEKNHPDEVTKAWLAPASASTSSPTLDHVQPVQAMLDAFVRHGALWCEPSDDGRFAVEASCLARLLIQGSSLQGWSDDALRAMNPDQRDPNGKTLLHPAIAHTYARRWVILGGVQNHATTAVENHTSVSRLMSLGVDPSVADLQGNYPAHRLTNEICLRYVHPDVMKPWALDERWNWSTTNRAGASSLNMLYEHRHPKFPGWKSAKWAEAIDDLLNTVVPWWIEREAQVLRETMVNLPMNPEGSVDALPPASTAASDPTSRSRRRL